MLHLIHIFLSSLCNCRSVFSRRGLWWRITNELASKWLWNVKNSAWASCYLFSSFFEFHLTAWNLAIAYKCYIVLYKYSWNDFSLKILLYVISRMNKWDCRSKMIKEHTHTHQISYEWLNDWLNERLHVIERLIELNCIKMRIYFTIAHNLTLI